MVMFPKAIGIGHVPIFPPSRHKVGTGCLIKKLTLFPSKPKSQTSSKGCESGIPGITGTEGRRSTAGYTSCGVALIENISPPNF